MAEVFIYDHVRSPRGKGRPSGALHEITPINLTAQTLAELRDRNSLDTSMVDDIGFGCVSPVQEQGACIPRVGALYAGYDTQAPGFQVHRFCASGLEAVNICAAKVMAGQCDLTIAGGVEMMSRVKMGADQGAVFNDPDVSWHLYSISQGVAADLIATQYGFSREDVDAYALESQRRAANAWDNGYFDNSVFTVKDILGSPLLSKDEHFRPGTTMDDLAALAPAFQQIGEQFGHNSIALQRYPEVESINHVHTAGNSSGIVDGAAAVLLGNAEAGERMGLKPRARIRQCASIGSEPTIMLTGPTPSAEKVLKLAGMTKGDIDLFELNEAFASVVMKFMTDLDIDHNQINVNGGAIAMGHPLGASGAIILGTVLDELERRDLNTALVNLCVGAGMGTATIIERV